MFNARRGREGQPYREAKVNAAGAATPPTTRAAPVRDRVRSSGRRLFWIRWDQRGEGGAPASGTGVPAAEARDERRAAKMVVDGFAQRAGAFAVDDADFGQAAGEAGLKVGGEQLLEVLGSKRVQVQFTGDGDLERRDIACGVGRHIRR